MEKMIRIVAQHHNEETDEMEWLSATKLTQYHSPSGGYRKHKHTPGYLLLSGRRASR
jgi:hypothetical protein